MNKGDKVVFKRLIKDAVPCVFEVVDVQGDFAKIEPGSYGQKDMIVNVTNLELA